MAQKKVMIGKQEFTITTIPKIRETGEIVDDSLNTKERQRARTDLYASHFGLRRKTELNAVN